MEVHPAKFQLLQVRCNDKVCTEDGQQVSAVPSLDYLGSTLASDGSVAGELSRRIGIAKADFRTLCKVWRHSTLTRHERLSIFGALIESRLMYGLSTACFCKAELRRLNGFQARCLRTIMGIAPAFISRVSNETVLRCAHYEQASAKLSRQQLLLLGKILRSPLNTPLQEVSFIPGTLQPATDRYVRRVGRPCREWIPLTLRHAFQVTGTAADLISATEVPHHWKDTIRNACF